VITFPGLATAPRTLRKPSTAWENASAGNLVGMEEPLVERRIREAIPNLDRDPDWWVNRWIERENLKDDLGRGRAPRREGPRDPEGR